jgi:hypothetical protein
MLRSWLVLLVFPLGLFLWWTLVGVVFPLRLIERGAVARARRNTVVLFGGGALLIAAFAVFGTKW